MKISPWAHATLGALILLVFGVGLRAPLIYDDASFVLKNPLVTGPWPGLRALLTTSFSDQREYEPLGTLFHRGLYALAGEEPFLYRFTSLLLHWGTAGLLLTLSARILGSVAPAWAAAALFALYPGQTEVLAVSTFKKHLLVGLLAAAILNLQTLRPRRAVHAWAACLGLGLALLAKETALVIPLLTAASSWAAGDGRWGRLKEDSPWLRALGGIAVAFVLVRVFLIPRAIGGPVLGNWTLHLFTSAKLFCWSLAQLPLPWDLCLEHSLKPVRSISEGLAFAAAAAGAGVLLRWCARRDRVLGLGAAWTVLALLPFMNLVPYLNYSLVANRYLYLASAGFFLALARTAQLILERKPRLRTPALSAGVCLGLSFAAVDSRRMGTYGDVLELAENTARCAPGNPRAHANLSSIFLGLRLTARAEEEALRAFRLAPTDLSVLQAVGWVYARTGRLEEAIRLLEEPARLSGDPGSLETLGALQIQARRPSAALDALRAARARGTVTESNHLNTGIALGMAGKSDDAERELLPLAEHGRLKDQTLKALGDLYRGAGRLEEASSSYRLSLEAAPMQADTVRSLARLEAGRGRRAEAARILERFAGRLELILAPMRGRHLPHERALLREAEGILAEIRRAKASL